jgi:hypothetical protein
MAFSDKGDVTKVETPIEVNITVAGSDPTGINSLNAEDSNEPAFNLAGQKVSNNYKGIVVKRGYKYVAR